MPIPRPQATNHPAVTGAPPSEARRELLRNSTLFSHLDDAEADAILADAQVRHYSERAQIFAKGDRGDSMMAVLHGRVVISDSSLDGRQVVLTTLRDGDVFGEMALVDGKERSANATAAATCELLVVRRNSFLSLLQHRPDVCMGLMVVLCERLRHTNEQVEDFAFLGLERRIAKLLLRLASEAHQSAASPARLKISQRAVGELVGGSRERTNKLLQNWRRAGIIAIENGSIQICDTEALADLV